MQLCDRTKEELLSLALMKCLEGSDYVWSTMAWGLRGWLKVKERVEMGRSVDLALGFAER